MRALKTMGNNNQNTASKKTVLEWKGYAWKLFDLSDPKLKIWYTSPQSSEKTYQRNLLKFTNVGPEAIKIIETIFQIPKDLVLELAIFPKSHYREKLGLAKEIPQWVQVCVRDNRICYEHSIADFWGDSLKSVPSEQKRELIHEFVHPTLFSMLGKRVLPLTVEEGLAEAIPRIILNYQKELPESTRYLLNKLPNELLSPQEIDTNGMFKYSQNPLSINRAYMSSLVYTLGLCVTIAENVDLGIRKIIEQGKNISSSSEFYSLMSGLTGLSKDIMLTGKPLQLKGLEIIEKLR